MRRALTTITTAERVRMLIVNELGVAPEAVTTDARMVEDLGADSLDTVELCLAIEEEFGCEISDDEYLAAFETVGGLVKLVERKVAE